VNDKKIFVASDHAGYKLKEYMKNRLTREGYKIEDMGVFSEEPTDYPDIISQGAKAVAKHKNSVGLLMCGSGIGASIVANKIKGIRAALLYSKDTARLSRLHNDANVAVFGGRLIKPKKAYNLFKLWLSTPFSNQERHKRRIKKIFKLEGKK